MDFPLAGLICWFCVIGVMYSYIGYPLTLMLLAHFKPRLILPVDKHFKPKVTLLIAAYNEERVIKKKLENSLLLDYPKNKLQILVVVDGSDDKTLDIVKSFYKDGVEYSYTPKRQGKMAAINRALEHVKGDIIVFSDANNHYEKMTIQYLVGPFLDERWGAVSGVKHISDTNEALGASEGLYWKYESIIKTLETRIKTCTAVAGEILAIRRDLYTTPPEKIINDDFFLAMNILAKGYHIYYEPKARSLEPASQSSGDEIVRRSRINAGRYQAMGMGHRYLSLKQPMISWQIISHKFSRPLVPIAMILLFLLTIICLIWPYQNDNLLLAIVGLSPPYNWVLFVFQMIFYSLAMIGHFLGSPKSMFGKIIYLTTFLFNTCLF